MNSSSDSNVPGLVALLSPASSTTSTVDDDGSISDSKWLSPSGNDGSNSSSNDSGTGSFASYFTTTSSSSSKRNHCRRSAGVSSGRRQQPRSHNKGKGSLRCCRCEQMIDLRGFAKPQRQKGLGGDDAECRSCVWKGIA